MKRNRRALLVAAVPIIALFTAIVALSTAAAGGSRTDADVPELRVGMVAALSGVNVAKSNITGNLFVSSLVHELLTRTTPDQKLVPHLATRMQQPNPFTYIYTLRKGVKFWDGTELTAADVANSLNYNRYPGAASSSPWVAVRSITATGRYTVQITLKRRDASLPAAPARWEGQIFEKKFADEHKDTLGQPGTFTMGTGPYRLDSIDQTRGAELSAVDSYWGGRPQIRRLSIKRFLDETSMALAFRAGEIDVALRVGSPKAFEATSGKKLVRVPSCRNANFIMNSGVPPFNDVHVRRAVAYAINRGDLITARGGFAQPNFTLVPPSQLYSLGGKPKVDALLKKLPQYPFNLAKAKQEMAQSGYPNGFNTTLTISANTDVVQTLAAQLKLIGINAVIAQVPAATWSAAITGPANNRPNTFSESGCNSPDPGFMTYLLGSTKAGAPLINNYGNYTPAAVNDLLSATVATADPAKRLDAYDKLLTKLALDVPYVPIWVSEATYAISDKFTWPTYTDLFFTRPWALEIKPK